MNLQALVDKGKHNALAVLNQVNSQINTDMIVPTKQINFQPYRKDDLAQNEIAVVIDGQHYTLHNNARNQLCEKLGVPSQFAKKHLLTDWGTEMISENFQRIAQHSESRNLVRSVNGQVRGVLSDTYRRIDTRPLLDSFMAVCTELGLVPIDGYALDTRVTMRVVLPRIYKTPNGDEFVYGLEWGNSDFGVASHTVKFFKLRLICTNGATARDMMRQVHLGGRLSDDIQYSEKTMQLDTEANAMALRDVVRYAISEGSVTQFHNQLIAAGGIAVSDNQAVTYLKNISKEDSKNIVTLYNSPDNVNMPQGKSRLRLAEAVSFFAQTESFGRAKKLELEELSGKILIGEK